MVRPPRKSQLGCVGLDNHDRVAKSLTERRGAYGVSFYGDHARTGLDEKGGYRADAGTDIDDERAWR